jgi:hypothetical protein
MTRLRVQLFSIRCAVESEAFGGDLRAKREPEGRSSGRATPIVHIQNNQLQNNQLLKLWYNTLQ